MILMAWRGMNVRLNGTHHVTQNEENSLKASQLMLGSTQNSLNTQHRLYMR